MVFLKKKKGLTPFHKGLLLGAVSVMAIGGAVYAVNSAKEPVGINEVGQTNRGNTEVTLTGMVGREAVEPSGKEKYILTTESGKKYLLVGLKQAYAYGSDNNDPNSKKMGYKPSTRPSPTVNPRKVNEDEAKAFEAFVGKKVTVIGFALSLNDDNRPSPTPRVQPKKVKSGKRLTSPTPTATPSPKPSATPKDNGQEFDRFAVKDIAIVQ